MQISRWLPLLLSCVMPSLHAATIQSFGITPDNALPGDLVTAHFQIDGTAPTDGQASVWIDGVEQCRAQADRGYFRCTFGIPHGGNFRYELRFRDSFGVTVSSLQQASSGGLRIIKIQPATVQAGRSAIIFAKLDYLHPGANPQPQGQIQITSTDGLRQCSITLPQQTYCQMQFDQAGRYFLKASYSGDISYPSLESAISEIRVANPVEQPIYQNEVPLTPPIADQTTNSAVGTLFDAYGTNVTAAAGQVLDFSVGAQVLSFRADFFALGFIDTSRVYGAQSKGVYRVASARGELQDGFNESGNVWTLDKLYRRVVQTDQALVAADTNLSSDWYLKDQGGGVIEWLSKKSSGSATERGIPYAVVSDNAIAFISNENGIVSDDQDGLPDLFLAREDLPTLRLPLPPNRDSAPIPLRLNSASNLLICNTILALTPDDLDTRPDNYLFNPATGSYRRIPEALSAYDGYFSPEDSALLHDYMSNTLVVVPPAGATKSFVLSASAVGYQLKGSTPGHALFLGGANRSHRLLVDLNTGAEHYASGRLLGDEQLLAAYTVALNKTGSHLVSATTTGWLAVRADGTQRQLLAAEITRGLSMDADERYIAFSSASALLPDDTNQVHDVYEWDQHNSQLRRLSRRIDGSQTTGSSDLLAYSRTDGFALISLRPDDLSGINALPIARVNLVTGEITATPDVGSVGAPAYRSNSRNGRWAVFYSREGSDLVRVETQTGAIQTLAGLYSPSESPVNVAISDDGNHVVASIRTANGIDVRWQNLRTGHTQSMFRPTESTAQIKISADGRYALVGAYNVHTFPSTGPTPPTRLFLIDLQRALLSEKLADVKDFAFDFSGDASMIAYGSYRLAGGQIGGVTLRENPYFKIPSYTTIVRTVPVQLNLAQDFLVEAIVSHKEAGVAPSGIIRFDDGYGAQCDGTLVVQGELAIAQCRLLPNAQGLHQRQRTVPTSPLELPITANYLGDVHYGPSRSTRSFSVRKPTPSFRWQHDQTTVAPEVRIGIEVDALPDAAFTGSATITTNVGTPCFLSAAEIQASKRCRFFIPHPGSYPIRVTLDDPIYALGSGSLIYLTVRSDTDFANGFE